MFDAIEDTLNTLRPFIQRDGGDVELVDFVDGVVYVRLLGACSGCPSSIITLKSGIERALLNDYPNEVTSVEQVFD